MSEIFIKLLNMSISAGWLVICVVALRLILKKAPRWIACILWALVAVRLLCPFSLESVLSLVPSAETIPEEIIYSESPEIESGIPVINSTVNPIISDSLAPAPKDFVNPMEIITGVASVLWIVGVAAMAIYAVVSYIRIRKRVSEAVRDGDGVWICDRIDTPFILGLFSPRIILPSSLSGEDREYVISHERAHLSRMDHIWKPLGYTILTVYWFNPLIWIAYILLSRDIEAACDEKVIKQLGEGAKKPYAEALINCSVPRRMISACPLAFGESGVKERVRNVLNYKKPAFWIIIVSVIACVATGIFFLTDPKKEKDPDKDGNAVVDTTDDEITSDETTAETIEDKYNKAKTSLTTLDETKKEEILDSYSYDRISWYDIDSEYARNGYGMRCYGEFESCIVLFESTEATVIKTKKIADSEFTHTSSFGLYAYHDNCLYSLEEAYDKGFISSDEVEIAAERHRIVEDYLRSLRTVDNTTENEITKIPEETTGVPEDTTRVPEETTGKPIETKPPSVPADTTGKENKPVVKDQDTTVSEPIAELKAPTDQLLGRIENDYYTYNKKSNKDADFYNVQRYYGEYNGSVVIMFRMPMPGWLVVREETVAESAFRYNTPADISVWKNGSFYSLKEAYKGGVLTKKEIASIAEIHKESKYINFNRYNVPEEDSDKNKWNPEPPTEGLLVQISKDFCEYHVEKYNFDPEIHGGFYVAKYYGTYNNTVPVILEGTGISYATVITTETVAGYTFTYPCSNTMWVWNNGSFYSLQDAYDKGLLTKEDIAEIFAVKPIEYDVMEYGYPN